MQAELEHFKKCLALPLLHWHRGYYNRPSPRWPSSHLWWTCWWRVADQCKSWELKLLNVWFQLWHEKIDKAISHCLVPMSDASLWLPALQVQPLYTGSNLWTKQAFSISITWRINLTGRLKDQCQEVQKTNPELFTCRWLLEPSSNLVQIFIQFLKEYDYVKYCQIAFCMFLLLMMNYKKDCSLENKYFNVFCRGKKCVKVLLVRNVGERQKWSGWTWVLNSKGLIWKWLSSTILTVFLYIL